MTRRNDYRDKDGNRVRLHPYRGRPPERNRPRAEKKLRRRARTALRLAWLAKERGLVIRSPRVRRLCGRMAGP